MFDSLQNLVVFVLSLAAFAAAVWALADALRFPNSAYVAAGKQSKLVWGVILGIAAAVTFVLLPHPIGRGGGVLNLFGIIVVVAVIYYFIDVRKRLAEHYRRGSGGATSGNRGGW